MNRRQFIKHGAAAGMVLGVGNFGLSCSRRGATRTVPAPGEHPHLEPWGWQVLHYASLAPSGHNSQPWVVRVEAPGSWVVGADPERRLPVVDQDNREVLLSIGAFLENLVQAAAAIGYEAEVEVVAEDRADEDLARVTLAPAAPRPVSLKRLESRRTLKTGFLSRELRAGDIGVFEAAAGQGLHYFPRSSSHSRLMSEAALENFRIQFENDRAMAEAAAWTRLSDRDARKYMDGLRPDGMEISGLSGWFVRHFMDTEDVAGQTWRKRAVEKAAEQVGQGGGWIVITSPGRGVGDLVAAGRRFQRMALSARGMNIGIHPMTQTLEEAHGVKQVRDNHAPSMIPQFMLRVGYVDGYPDPVSFRRPVGWFLV